MSGDRTTSSLECFLKVLPRDHGYGVLYTFHVCIVCLFTIFSSQSPTLFLSRDALPNGSFGGPLAQFCDISAREILCELSAEFKSDVGSHGTLSQVGLEDVDT